jgi:hypothetical protein
MSILSHLSRQTRSALFLGLVITILLISSGNTLAATESGSVGVQGLIPTDPPSQGATISVPTNGQGFTTIPITVSGICSGDVLVKLFKNNVFAGSAQCNNGSYSIVLDLFNGQNELVARVFDALDQAGPDSNKVTVTYTDIRQGTISRVSLTSNFAKRGANPGEKITWPIILSGGTGPYAISVDWGDGKAADLKSQEFPGTFNIDHVYDSPGVYNIVIKATDKNGGVAFLQIVGVANGPLSQTNSGQNEEATADAKVITKILWQPMAVMLPLTIMAFWLGKKYELKMLKKKIEQGERPF